MPPIHARKNQYRGVNAHLNSYMQANPGWKEYHTAQIGDIAVTLKAELFPRGYTVGIEDSIQIRLLSDLVGQPESDVAVFDRKRERFESEAQPLSMEVNALVLPAPEILSLQDTELGEYKAIAIYEFQPGRSDRGRPVAWLELLSPSNKSPGQRAAEYLAKRTRLLEGGFVFVEIDYLHETSPMVAGVADYRTRRNRPAEPGSHPYRVTVIVPRPELAAGQGYIYEFDVDEPVPVITIPLSGAETIDLDLNVAYNKTFEELLYGPEFVDYSQLPANFDRYSPADQSRIAARMLAIHAAVARGDDLESGAVLPVETVELETALAQIEAWQAKE